MDKTEVKENNIYIYTWLPKRLCHVLTKPYNGSVVVT